MAYDYYVSAFYDWRHGIRTTDIEPLATLELTHAENLAHANSYSPSDGATIHSIFRNLNVDPRDYSFVDFGCGKGRVMAEAIRHPFQSVIGVDFAKELCEVSKANLERVRSSQRCGSVEIHHMDATEFDLPPTPCVAYIYNSFRDPVLSAVLANIRASVEARPRHVRIVAVEPVLYDVFDRVPGIRVFKSERRYAMYDLCDPNAGSSR